jgi:hypothetical protein
LFARGMLFLAQLVQIDGPAVIACPVGIHKVDTIRGMAEVAWVVFPSGLHRPPPIDCSIQVGCYWLYGTDSSGLGNPQEMTGQEGEDTHVTPVLLFRHSSHCGRLSRPVGELRTASVDRHPRQSGYSPVARCDSRGNDLYL